MHFDLVDLRIFLCVAESPSLTQGAKKAFISPSSASTRIKSLEEQLECRLFYRHNRGLDLTPAGIRLLYHARSVLRKVNSLKMEFSALSSDQSGHLRIYANSTAVTEFLPEILAKFLVGRPAVTIDLQEHITQQIFRAVLEDTADIGIVAGDVLLPSLQNIHFSTDRLTVLIPKHHPLTQFEKVKFVDTLKYPYISLHKGSTLESFLNEKKSYLDISMSTRIHVSSFESMCRFIEADIGIGIAPESAAHRHMKTMSLQKIALDEDWAIRERSIVIKELDTLSSVGKALIKSIVENFDSTVAL